MIKKVAKAKTKKAAKRTIDPQKLKQLKQKRSIRALFARIGFKRIPADGIQFRFMNRNGELDDIFLIENILIIAEYTVGKTGSAHVATKSIIYTHILNHTEEWVNFYSDINSEFKAEIDSCGYASSEIRVRIVYVSLEGVSDDIETAFPDYRFLDGTRLRYFDALSKTIHKSARHEFYKYLGLDYSEIGEQVLNTSGDTRNFDGYMLPEAHSGYPKGFKVVSFYADPGTLLAVSYVLRKDSWRDGEGLYQRILIKNKIASMRRYLVDAKRVFVNNIVVTLPPNTQLNDPPTSKNIAPEDLDRLRQVRIGVPYSANMIGLVDGQHRIFCYHEANDPLENKISTLRKRQNLLVTGLIFPNSWNDHQKRQFEAKLFLEINDNQARAKSGLKQSIELILNPYSTIAIAKEVTNRLSKKGPLAGLLQTNFFDSPEMIKTTSIVSYGLRPLLKLDGQDSLFAAWKSLNKENLADNKTDLAIRKSLLENYLNFCVDEINKFLLAMMTKTGPERWKIKTDRKDQFLTPTTINGFFVCIRKLVENKKLTSQQQYETKLNGVESFTFGDFKSSAWKSLGDGLYTKYFA
ncbi:MAG: DNA sulfur modification protein DndB [Sideroxyarcus sp.]|nr:DNA sulfur modification protein DndB [Sideroxyarcus sp.]